MLSNFKAISLSSHWCFLESYDYTKTVNGGAKEKKPGMSKNIERGREEGGIPEKREAKMEEDSTLMGL